MELSMRSKGKASFLFIVIDYYPTDKQGFYKRN